MIERDVKFLLIKNESVNTVLSLQDSFISLNPTSTRPGEQSKVNTALPSVVGVFSYQKHQVSHFCYHSLALM